MATKKVYINPGHSDKDPGAVGYEVERKLTVQVANHMEDYLKENYIVSLKKTPGSIDYPGAIREANNWKANLFVSIHFNSAASKSAHGGEVLVYDKNNKALANTFWKYIKAIGQEPHGDPIKYRPDLAVLRSTNMKAILIECAFVSSKDDIKDWNEPHELKKMGIAIAKATADYLNLPKKVKTPTYETLGEMNFRKSPSLEKGVVILGKIPKGTKLTGTVNSDGWLKTTYKSKTGYVRQKSGTKVYCKKLS